MDDGGGSDAGRSAACAAGVLLLGGMLGGCIEGLTQVAGVGAIYHTRCSSDMLASDGEYRATCTPEGCAPSFTSGPVSHVVVAMDPGRKIVGYAERVCFQDLRETSQRFAPVALEARD